VARRLEATCDGYRWVDPENLHVTLNFVGDVVDIEVPELCKLIKDSIEPFEPFEMSLHGVSGFVDADQPRVVWIGVDEGAEQLKSLFETLADVLHHWGVNKERNEYVPHMTLGRLARGGRWNDELLALIHKLRHQRSGPTYTPMATLKL